MIVVKVELHSAISGQVSEIARAVIHNTGGTHTKGDYQALTMRGRDSEALHKSMVSILRGQTKAVHVGEVKNHARLQLHVWHLVAKALTAMGYGEIK